MIVKVEVLDIGCGCWSRGFVWWLDGLVGFGGFCGGWLGMDGWLCGGVCVVAGWVRMGVCFGGWVVGCGDG